MAVFVLKKMFGNGFARNVSHRIAEYSWNEEADNDPFTYLIPAKTLFNSTAVQCQKTMLSIVYGIGLRILKLPMKFLAPIIARFTY